MSSTYQVIERLFAFLNILVYTYMTIAVYHLWIIFLPPYFFHRSLGDWTGSLKKLIVSSAKFDIEKCLKKTESIENYQVENREEGLGTEYIEGIKESSLDPVSILMHVEGPYGMPTIDLTGGYYKVILLIAGGIGKLYI